MRVSVDLEPRCWRASGCLELVARRFSYLWGLVCMEESCLPVHEDRAATPKDGWVHSFEHIKPSNTLSVLEWGQFKDFAPKYYMDFSH